MIDEETLDYVQRLTDARDEYLANGESELMFSVADRHEVSEEDLNTAVEMYHKREPLDYVLIKNGYFYRPNARGYTSSILEAGRFTKTEAEAHAHDVKEVTATPIAHFQEIMSSHYNWKLHDDLHNAMLEYGKAWERWAGPVPERGGSPMEAAEEDIGEQAHKLLLEIRRLILAGPPPIFEGSK